MLRLVRSASALRNLTTAKALGLATPGSLLHFERRHWPVHLLCRGGLSARFAHRAAPMQGTSSVAIGGMAGIALASEAGGSDQKDLMLT